MMYEQKNEDLKALIDSLKAFADEHPENEAVDHAFEGLLESAIQAIKSDAERTGDILAELNSLSALVDTFPERSIVYAHLSGVLIELNKFKDARSLAEMGLRVAPDDPDLLFNHALCLMEFEEYDGAIKHFKRVLAIEPDTPWAYTNMGECFRQLGDLDAAETYLQLARRRYPEFAPAYHNLAMLAMDRAEWEACAHYASIAVRCDPLDSDLRLALGDAFLSLERWKDALNHLQYGTLLDPFDSELFESLSVAYAELGKLHLAEGAAREALALDPGSWRACGNLAYVYGKRGDHKSAIDASLQALERDPDEVGRQHIYWDLGWSNLQMEDLEKALDFTEKALAMGVEQELRLNKSLILLAMGREDEAAIVFHETFDDVENLPALYDEMEGLEEAHQRFGASYPGRLPGKHMPTCMIKLGKAYYNKGFFNVPVDFDRYVKVREGAIDIRIDDQIIIGRMSRQANRNGTARIFGRAALRDWFQRNFKLGDEIRVEFLSPGEVRLLK